MRVRKDALRQMDARRPIALVRCAKAMTHKMLVALLAASLATGQLPAAAWAQDAGSVPVSEDAATGQGAADGMGGSLGDGAGGAGSGVSDGETGSTSDTGAGSDSGSTSSAGDSGTGSTAGDSVQPGTGGLSSSGVTGSGADQPSGGTGETSGEGDTLPGESDGSQASAGTQPNGADNSSNGLQASDGPETPEDGSDADELAATVNVSSTIIGIDAAGEEQAWAASTSYEMDEGSTAADLLERQLADAGLSAVVSGEGESWYLSSIAAPYDPDTQIGWDEATGRYWQLFVNGKAAELGAGQIELAEGDRVALYYSAFGDELPEEAPEEPADEVTATIAIAGPDANGNAVWWADASELTLEQGATAADLTELALEHAGLAADCGVGEWGWFLNAITSPFTGESLGYDADTGAYWQLYVNGASSELGAGSVVLEEGDSIVWGYAAYGDEQPDPDELPIDPDAERPDYDASWVGFGNAGGTTLVNVPTPSEAADEKWAIDLRPEGTQYISAGDPIIAGGSIYVTSSTELIKVNAETGAIEKRVTTGGRTSYFSRPVYAGGLIIVPSDDGSLSAFTADTLTRVWRTPALEAPANGGRYQANSTLTVTNGCVIAGFEAGAGAMGNARAGALVCVRISDGRVMWQNITVAGEGDAGAGYYWAGACASGDEIIIGDEAGRVQLIDAATGEVISSAYIGMACRSTIVSAGTEDGNPVYLAVGRGPATLFKIVREGDTLRVAGSVAFASSSTSTPAVADGVAYVGGIDAEYHGVLVAIDLATMEVAGSYRTESSGEVKSSPLVSVQGDDTYVYFTSNSKPGGVYRYAASTGAVELIYTPGEDQQNYCTASVIADADGNLYYTNDSGHLFCLSAAAGYTVRFDSQGGSEVSGARPVQGGKLLKPADPVRDGYRFAGWYVDADGTVAWDFDDPVTGDMTLYAKWVALDEGGRPGGGSGSTGTGSGTGSQQPTAPQGPSASAGTVAPGARPLAAGTVAAAHAPLAGGTAARSQSQVASDAAQAGTSAEASGADGGRTVATAVGGVSDSAGRAAELATNTWAYAGVAAGAAGLIAIGAYLAFGRSRYGKEE